MSNFPDVVIRSNKVKKQRNAPVYFATGRISTMNGIMTDAQPYLCCKKTMNGT
jgi:hypothetical protein